MAEHPQGEPLQGFWLRWSQAIEGRARYTSVLALALIAVIALPFFSMRQGLADAGNDPVASTYSPGLRPAGQGFRRRLQRPARGGGGDQRSRPTAPASPSSCIRSRDSPTWPSFSPSGPAPTAKRRWPSSIPSTAPQAAQTSSLLHRVRGAIPAAEAGTTLAIHVGGPTAAGEDFAHVLTSKLPQFVAVVVILAFLLLMVVFRSILVPLVASVMNLLSIGAALGVLTAAFQWGWGKSILGYTKTGPIEVFLPVMLFAILFGLSMDYEVFLVSRIHEEWINTGDNDQAVTLGLAETGRVITAAALHHDPGVPVVRLRRPAGHQGVRTRLRGSHLHRRLRHPDRPGSLRNAPDREGQLVATGVARPPSAEGPRRRRRARIPRSPIPARS